MPEIAHIAAAGFDGIADKLTQEHRRPAETRELRRLLGHTLRRGFNGMKHMDSTAACRADLFAPAPRGQPKFLLESGRKVEGGAKTDTLGDLLD
jgi:hypothetical protein